MANHSYVYLDKKISVEEADRLLRKIVNAWDSRVVVEEYTPPPEHGAERGRRSWNVFIPGSELDDDAAMRAMKAPEDPYGFTVWFHPGKAFWEFRHPSNAWEWWAQDKVQHEIAKALGIKTLENDGIVRVDTSEHKKTYREHITRNYKPPYTADDQKWFDKLLAMAPEGFRE